jgi:two-component system nitrate/nitrite response regulator NarL
MHNILLVEDNPLSQQLLYAAIEKLALHSKVHSCANGSQALELIDQPDTHINLALIDLGLPDIGGIDIIQKVRKRFGDIPIMVISSITSERALFEAIRAGAKGYILKSQSVEATSLAIQDVLIGNYPISPGLAHSLFRLAGAPLEKGTIGFNLTPRELETLQHLAKGNTYKEVAKHMGISLSTVQFNIRNLYRKLDVFSQVQAVSKARDEGLI